MRRFLPLALVCATSTAAVADGYYFTESAGGTSVKDELGARMSSAVRVKLSLGMRVRNWAVEGFVAGDIASTEHTPPTRDGISRPDVGYGPSSLTSVGIDVKYLQSLAPHLEIYLRGTIAHGEMTGQLQGYGGRGLGMGAGIQLKGKVPAIGFLWWPLFFTDWGPKVTASLFLDDGYEFYRLHKGGDLNATPAIDAQLSHVTVGFGVGTDF